MTGMGARTPHAYARSSGAAFTLVELLVVIGLIGVLIAVLLPTLRSMRESARRTACLSNVRVLTQAALAYASQNRGCLPEASSVNAAGDGPLSPRGTAQAEWSPLSGGMAFSYPGGYVLPSIGSLLRSYLDNSTAPWRCPSAPENESMQPTVAGDNAFSIVGPNPYAGRSSADQFKPNYSYGAGKEFFSVARAGGPAISQFRLRDWAARNVSGLRIAQASAVRGGSGAIVLFQDRQSTYHSEGRANIYTAAQEFDFRASFGYLDGHAELRSYRSVTGYLGSIHPAIPQRWFNADFETVFAEQY
jgi:type II secretory pathway pseudopilin PulG